MIRLPEATNPSGWLFLFALDVTIKAVGLLVVAYAVHFLLGRRRALARSTLWNACLVGLILIPASSLLFPRLSLPVLAGQPSPPPLEPTSTPPAAATPHPFFDEPDPVAPGSVASINRRIPTTSTPALVSPGPVVTPRAWRFNPWEIILGLYLAVVAVLLARLIAALLAVGRLGRQAQAVEAPGWLLAVDRWRSRLGIARRVALLQSNRVSVPVVVGWLRPTILLPEGLADRQSPSLIDAVLLHELSHVRRGDYAWNLVRKLTQAVYWPHPLTWPLGRIIGATREQACDDLCVGIMGGASGYRSSLIAVASTLIHRPETTLGLAMARSTHLARRLAWIDRSPGSSTCLMPRPARLTVMGVVLLVSGVLGSIELAHAQTPATPRAPVDAPKPADPPQVAPVSPPKSIEVEVFAHDTGKPLAGATMKSWVDRTIVEQKTDRQGKVRLDLSQRLFGESLNFDVWADGYVQQRYFFAEHDARHPKAPPQITVSLWPGEETLGGKVVNEAGQAIAGVKVKVFGYPGAMKDKHELVYMVDTTTDDAGEWRSRNFREMKFANLYLSHPDYLTDDSVSARGHGQPTPSSQPRPGTLPMDGLRDFSDVQVMKKGVAIAGKVVDGRGKAVEGAEVGWIAENGRDVFHDGLPRTTTDGDGGFRFGNVAPGRVNLQVIARGHAPALEAIDARPGVEPVTIELGAPRTLAGRVVDSAGKPIVGASVSVNNWRGSRALGVFLRTDAEGRFRWEDAPDDPLTIQAWSTGFVSSNSRRVTAGDENILLTLRRAFSISGVIRDSGTGKAIDDVRVEVGGVDRLTGEIYWRPDNRLSALQGQMYADLDAENLSELQLRFQARGYQPLVSRVFRSIEGQVRSDITLIRLPMAPLSGVVRRPDGQPLEGAEVALARPMIGGRYDPPIVQIIDGRIMPSEKLEVARTDAQGRFSILGESITATDLYSLVVSHPDFYGEAPRAAFEADPLIEAQPWGRIEGVARIGGKAAAGHSVRWDMGGDFTGDTPFVWAWCETKADADGRFVINRVVPGEVVSSLALNLGENKGYSGTPAHVDPGQTVRIDLGGRGRPVKARIVRPEGFDPKVDVVSKSTFSISRDGLALPQGVERVASRNRMFGGPSRAWLASAAGRDYLRNDFGLSFVKLESDGTIFAEDIPPGDYQLSLTYVTNPPKDENRREQAVAHATVRFTIPPIPGGRTDEPLDLGEIRPVVKPPDLNAIQTATEPPP